MSRFPSAPPPQPPHHRVMGFIDIGYLEEAGNRGNTGQRHRIDGSGLVTVLAMSLSTWAGMNELIRVYVYDAEHDPEHPDYQVQHQRFDKLASTSGLRLRRGQLIERKSPAGKARLEQKGVDTLLVLDLVRMAQPQAYDIAVVCTGDRDFAEAVRVVGDDYSRRVWLWIPEQAPVAKELLHAADSLVTMGPTEINQIFRTTAHNCWRPLQMGHTPCRDSVVHSDPPTFEFLRRQPK